MTIEIQRPELEALIIQRMKSGGFHNVEDALFQALKMSPPVEETLHEKRTGADLIAALQASPYRELDIEPPKVRLTTVRDVVLDGVAPRYKHPLGNTAVEAGAEGTGVYSGQSAG